jgi:hypothetical protein
MPINDNEEEIKHN